MNPLFTATSIAAIIVWYVIGWDGVLLTAISMSVLSAESSTSSSLPACLRRSAFQYHCAIL